MDYFREQIDRIVYEQKKLLENYTKEYALSRKQDDEDRLICCRNSGKNIYYRARKENGKYIRKSLTKNQDELRRLARKEYLRVAIDALNNNTTVFDNACEKLEGLDIESLVPQMHKAYRGLPEECFFANETGNVDKLSGDKKDRFQRHREWANELYEKSSYKPDRLRYMTSGGFRVRSKSEQIIVEQLISYGVPFRYEQVIHVNEMSYSADFTFRDISGEFFYWEHAGMMDIPAYVSSYYRKMKAFDSIGIVPWKNLIITYDIDGGINIPMIKSIIENEVIPRL